ncbi:F-box/LRR-repeat protein 21 [Striga asiatica]|uniref:F-box/LRR-repeat protein 21 n=1 Tax=Striga asiatica TaxID=4170 RepID=A0A5A7QVC4_STRAF|nr:F-box/LRR-repeat protein 21 [Striga asiatica]
MWMYKKIRWRFWVSPYATCELFPTNKREGRKVCLGSYGDGAGCILGFQLVLCTLKNTKGLGKLRTLKKPFMMVAAHTPPGPCGHCELLKMACGVYWCTGRTLLSLNHFSNW